jgi:hypothetical protein
VVKGINARITNWLLNSEKGSCHPS